MENLVKTDIGLITTINANWLFKQGIITREGYISNNLLDGMVDKKVQAYSYFRWLIDDVKNKIPTTPKQVYLEIDDLIDVMRVGSIDKPYKVDEKEFRYIARYPKVDNVYNSGRKAFTEHQPINKGKKKQFVDFED